MRCRASRVVASDLVERVMKREGVSGHQVLKTVTGKDLVGVEYQHPFMHRDRQSRSRRIRHDDRRHGPGSHRPRPRRRRLSHRHQQRHRDLLPRAGQRPVRHTVPEWLQGKTVWEGNPKVTEKLKELDVLFAEEKIRHSYPHDWRSKTPTIFRATEQWFVAMDKPFKLSGEPNGEHSMRALALDAIGNRLKFVPDWGQARLQGMLESRPDWCISRQRAWGLPIPVFYNEAGEAAAHARIRARRRQARPRERQRCVVHRCPDRTARHVRSRPEIPDGQAPQGKRHLRRLVRIRQQLAKRCFSAART